MATSVQYLPMGTQRMDACQGVQHLVRLEERHQDEPIGPVGLRVRRGRDDDQYVGHWWALGGVLEEVPPGVEVLEHQGPQAAVSQRRGRMAGMEDGRRFPSPPTGDVFGPPRTSGTACAS